MEQLWPSIKRCQAKSVPHHSWRVKAFFAFTLLFVLLADPGRVVNDGEAVQFIVDNFDGACYLLRKLMKRILPEPLPGNNG